MTGPAEATPPPSGRWKTLVPLAAPALVFLTIVVQFLVFHEYALLLPESLALMTAAALSGVAVGALGRLRPETLAPMLMAVVLWIFALYQNEVTGPLVWVANAAAEIVDNVTAIVAVLGVSILVAISLPCVMLKRHLDTIVFAAFGTMVISTLVLPTTTGGEPVQAGTLPTKLENLPPVIHVILDEHLGLAGLPADLEGSAAAADAIRTTYRDFALYSRAYSRFAQTQYSLASLFNNASAADVMDTLEASPTGYILTKNLWLEWLNKKGYKIKVYQTDLLDMCSESEVVSACYTYPLFSVNAVQRSPLAAGARLKVLLRNLHIGRNIATGAPLAASEALDTFQSDLERFPRGVAYIVHLLLPHEGFIYREDCSVADPDYWEGEGRLSGLSTTGRRRAYDMYLGQVVCTERRISQLFDWLKSEGLFDDATIIVHGDHGSRIGIRPWVNDVPEELSARDIVDHFSTLLAIKMPGVTEGVLEEPVAVQQVFADIFQDGHIGDPPSGLVWVWGQSTRSFAERTLSWPSRRADESEHEANNVLRPSAAVAQ